MNKELKERIIGYLNQLKDKKEFETELSKNLIGIVEKEQEEYVHLMAEVIELKLIIQKLQEDDDL